MKAIFTICAKNYIAQALTLKQSVKKYCQDIEFFIFLSDLKDVDNLPEVVELDISWIPSWRNMAFKYNVIEFSTSIKPFCFEKLFNLGYESVIYLDPDIYVTYRLDDIFDLLQNKSMVLSPHYCELEINYTGSISEEEILWVGIYNLGFAALKNDPKGRKIIQWWQNRLLSKCYADKHDGLHVDQKWIDFLPAFFPNDVYITHHMGINPAIWNLHERALVIDKNQYFIRNLKTGKHFPLLFFHFSGFDPYNPNLINRRHPKYTADKFPSFLPLIEEYVKHEYENNYDYFSKLSYSFNNFDDGEIILPIHRRLFRVLEDEVLETNPFSASSNIRKIFLSNRLLSGLKVSGFSTFTNKEKNRRGMFEKIIVVVFKIIKIIVGIRYYARLLFFLNIFTRFENQVFLLKKKK